MSLRSRLSALERRRSDERLRQLGSPTYTFIRKGEPRPDADGPVYVLAGIEREKSHA